MSETWSITTWQLGAAISGVPHSNQTKMHSKRYSNNGKYHYMSCLSILPNQNPCSLACAAYRHLQASNYAINRETLKTAFQNKLTHNPVRNVTSQWRRWYRKVIWCDCDRFDVILSPKAMISDAIENSSILGTKSWQIDSWYRWLFDINVISM